MKIQVPATTSNLGPGLDSCGLALALYLRIQIGPESAHWEVQHNLGPQIPNDQQNLIVKTAVAVAGPHLPPHQLSVMSDIPVQRGLGSSAAAVVGGIELANRLANLNLSIEEKITLATGFEHHPDHVAPAIRGNFVTAAMIKDHVYSVRHFFPDSDFVIYIPREKLPAIKSREVLPATLNYSQAIAGSAVANVMIAAILNGDLNLAGDMMEHDLLQERYRDNFVPFLKQMRTTANALGAYGTFISGAGPAIITMCPEESTEAIKAALMQKHPTGTVISLSADKDGIQVF
ncbi:homoserine kinase [Loigolactobacillus zhaoyuanensis]|uniref:Homoserine kinase n=1 Tax=Loigolactobacillus zhaoyuanensis TaxID=2486017 RepID=A0ABW8UD07_9LACO|nr:homoserine kinase [Loigolactobacillus zhaoyuanensis]